MWGGGSNGYAECWCVAGEGCARLCRVLWCWLRVWYRVSQVLSTCGWRCTNAGPRCCAHAVVPMHVTACTGRPCLSRHVQYMYSTCAVHAAHVPPLHCALLICFGREQAKLAICYCACLAAAEIVHALLQQKSAPHHAGRPPCARPCVSSPLPEHVLCIPCNLTPEPLCTPPCPSPVPHPPQAD